VAHIEHFIADYNHNLKLFIWTQSVVDQKWLKPCFAV